MKTESTELSFCNGIPLLRLFSIGLSVWCLVISAFAADPADQQHFEWLSSKMADANTVKAGMPVERLLVLFRREPGIARVVTEEDWRELKAAGDMRSHLQKIDTLAWVYHLESCPLIKINVKFVGEANFQYDPKPGSIIKWVSLPYIEPVVLDETIPSL
jgi:hypothetical protein